MPRSNKKLIAYSKNLKAQAEAWRKQGCDPSVLLEKVVEISNELKVNRNYRLRYSFPKRENYSQRIY